MNPKVSIILTTHGEGKYLSQAIASVLAQTYTDFELLVGCDHLENYQKLLSFKDLRIKHHYFRVPDETVCRFAWVINKSFKYSSGDFITYLCHDDLYLPYRLEVMVGVLEKLNLDIVFGNQQLIDATKEMPEAWGEVRTGSTNVPMGNVDHSSVMHKRECFEKVGGWDESAAMRYGDAFFWKRLLDAGYVFNGIDHVLDVHRFNKDSITWKEDNPEYPKIDDLGNQRTIESGVDAGWSAIEK